MGSNPETFPPSLSSWHPKVHVVPPAVLYRKDPASSAVTLS